LTDTLTVTSKPLDSEAHRSGTAHVTVSDEVTDKMGLASTPKRQQPVSVTPRLVPVRVTRRVDSTTTAGCTAMTTGAAAYRKECVAEVTAKKSASSPLGEI
jgi:hypothetical protein